MIVCFERNENIPAYSLNNSLHIESIIIFAIYVKKNPPDPPPKIGIAIEEIFLFLARETIFFTQLSIIRKSFDAY